MSTRWRHSLAVKKVVLLLLLVFLSVSGKILKANEIDVTSRIKVVWSLSEASMGMASIIKRYARVSGVEVELVILPSGTRWYHRVLAELAAGGDGFDILIVDYHYLPEFSESGYLEALAPYLRQSEVLSVNDFEPNAVKTFSEYPKNSANYWALPLQRDALALVYRKDLFDDPMEQKAFRQRFGYSLQPPKDRQQLYDTAKFFTRPEQDLWGWGQTTSEHNNAIVTSAISFIWSRGGHILSPSNTQAVGYLDSDSSIRGLEDYMEMFRYMPEHRKDWDYDDLTLKFSQSKITMGLNRVSSINVLNSNVTGQQFSVVRFPSSQPLLEGQAIAINQFSHNKQIAWKFIEWFLQTPQQWLFSQKGQSSMLQVVNSEKWLSVQTHNKLFKPILSSSKEYLKIPLYDPFMEIMQQEVSAVIHKEKSPREALTIAARRQQLLLKKSLNN